MSVCDATTSEPRAAASGAVLLTLASGQFLMTLDSSVMNVSIAQVAEDVGTTITGVQTAITLYTLVMATMMITGGKIGTMIGHRQAFAIGCVIYGAGSLTTALAPSLTVLIIGWSVLEGIGAALIMPAIVALVAGNFAASERPRAYGLVASAGAIAVAAGPLIGGAVTTYWTWRLVFAGEVIVVIGILAMTRRIQDAAPARKSSDRPGRRRALRARSRAGGVRRAPLRRVGLGAGRARGAGPARHLDDRVARSSAGCIVLRVFVWWETRMVERGREPLLDLALLRNARLVGGLIMFFFQFLLQAGLFFTIPLFLSVALGLSALDTGHPAAAALGDAADRRRSGSRGVWPQVSPRRVVTWGLAALLAGIVSLIGALESGPGPRS